jgi:predicted dehydrogenase
MDFGCYGANLATWLMDGEEPLTVTAVTQQFKPEIYAKVEDEATIVLGYCNAQAIIQASWNWPTNRKDLEVYGRDGYAHALDGRNIRLRKPGEQQDTLLALERRPAPFDEPFAYFAAALRGELQLSQTDLSSLANNMTVMRIADAGSSPIQVAGHGSNGITTVPVDASPGEGKIRLKVNAISLSPVLLRCSSRSFASATVGI